MSAEAYAVDKELARKKAALLLHLARMTAQLAVQIPWQALAGEDRTAVERAERMMRGSANMIRAAVDRGDVVKAASIPPAGIDPPFMVVNRRTEATAAGYFVPKAEVAFGNGLGLSGLIPQLSAPELQTLVAILACVTANGRIAPTVSMVAKALRVPSAIALVRLTALTHKRWRGRPILYRIDGGGGIWAYAVSPEILGQRLGPLETEPSASAIAPGAGRDAVIAASRLRHARPRAQVETDLVQRNGWPLPEEEATLAAAHASAGLPLEGDDLHARERLIKLGVEYRGAEALVRRYGRDRIARQIAYLPFRKAKDPVKLLMSSIEGDWEKPAGFPMFASAGDILEDVTPG